MKKQEFDNLKVGSIVYKGNFGGQVSEINRTKKRVSAIGIGNDIYWRYLHLKPRGEGCHSGFCGVCGEYEVVEKMHFIS